MTFLYRQEITTYASKINGPIMLPSENPIKVPAAYTAFFVCPATFDVPRPMH